MAKNDILRLQIFKFSYVEDVCDFIDVFGFGEGLHIKGLSILDPTNGALKLFRHILQQIFAIEILELIIPNVDTLFFGNFL